MANLNVTYDQMQSAATRLRNGQKDLESKLNELRSLVQQLVQNGFTTSRASGAFDSSYQEFTQGATRTVRGIDGRLPEQGRASSPADRRGTGTSSR